VDENDDATYNKGNETVVPGSTDALASLSWDFTDIDDRDDNSTHFNMTSGGRSYTIQFRNHFEEDEGNLKFDIVVEDYTFNSDDENVMLVLGFHLIGNEQEMTQEQNRIRFGNQGYFESETEANAGNETIQAGISNGEEGANSMAYISFERFEGRMVHDPTIGLSGDDGATIPGYSSISVFVLSMFMIGIISILITRKR
jgi:hypothetical protein